MPMRLHLSLIGIGCGNPDHLTRGAIRALNEADLLLIPDKGQDKSDLADLRHAILADVLTRPVPVATFAMPRRSGGDGAAADYLAGVELWHDAIADMWAGALRRHLPQGGRAGLMVWGDPSLYDSSLRIAARLLRQGLDVSVTVEPGITSLQALTAAHALPLNTAAGSVLLTTGRRLRSEGWPPNADTVAVMLDGGGAFSVLEPTGFDIWWGANLGLPDQRLDAGPLAEAGPRILAARAALKESHGWVMDIYLLRRRDG